MTLTPSQLLAALAAHPTPEAAAKSLGVVGSTFRNWCSKHDIELTAHQPVSPNRPSIEAVRERVRREEAEQTA